LLQHTSTSVVQIKADKFVFYTKSINNNDVWDSTLFRKKLQYGEDLGMKMENAFNELFLLGYKEIVILGSDIFDLQPKHIEDAFHKLENHDVVIGPAKDGGYYLLGMKTLHPQVFKNKKWGTDTVFQNTINDLQSESVFLLKVLNDIDVYEDIKDIEELKALIKR